MKIRHKILSLALVVAIALAGCGAQPTEPTASLEPASSSESIVSSEPSTTPSVDAPSEASASSDIEQAKEESSPMPVSTAEGSAGSADHSEGQKTADKVQSSSEPTAPPAKRDDGNQPSEPTALTSNGSNEKSFTLPCGDGFTISNYGTEATEHITIYTMFDPEPTVGTFDFYTVKQNTVITFQMEAPGVSAYVCSLARSEDGVREQADGISIENSEDSTYGSDITIKASDLVNENLPYAKIRIQRMGSTSMDGGMVATGPTESLEVFLKYEG